MGGDLTDDVDDIESNLDDINRLLSPMFKKIKELRTAVLELQEDLKHEENRNADFENTVAYFRTFIDAHHDLFTAWQVAERIS